MQIKKSTIYIFFLIISSLTIIFSTFLFLSNKKDEDNNTVNENPVSISGDKQIIDVAAKGGYRPSEIVAKANMYTVLRVNTKNTFDCSSAFTIPKLGIRKNLPVSGQTEFELGKQEAGSEIDATCTMGMYSFKIKFL